MRPQVGQVINNKYRLVRVIGDGGMGSVYEARHEVLGTTVALKFLHPELSRRSGLVQRFLQEAKVSAQIQSPHVVRVSDVDQMPTGQAFIVMEYLEGKTLQTLYEDLYNAGQRLSFNDALEYACQMLDGVEAAHRAGVVHRDLKPDNVMLTKGPKGEPLLKILDFGIAKLKVTGELDRGLTRPGVIMGTPEYMAPEQAYSADAVDVRADIFSLGVIIFEMLAGRRPVGGDEPQQIASSYLSGQIAQLTDLAPHVPPDLAKVVHKAMGPKPPDRYDTLADFRAELQPFAVAAHAPSAGVLVATPKPAPVAVNNGPTAQNSVLAPAPIPKTLPPADETPPPGVVGPGVTPQPGSPPAQIATPLGGFEAKPAGGTGTSINMPLPGVGQDGTAQAAPLPAAFESHPRPGGTAVGASLEASGGGGYGAPPNGYTPAPGAYNVPSGAYAPSPVQATPPGWQPQAGYPAPGAYGPTPGYAPAPTQPNNSGQRSGGAGIAIMLFIAFAVTAVVMGGVYLSQKLGRPDEPDTKPTQTLPPTVPVTSETPTATQTATTGVVATTNPPVFTSPPPPRPTTPTQTTTGPHTQPSGTTSSPQPSGTTSSPTLPPLGSIPGIPIQLPSGLPTGWPPIFGGGQPTASSPPTTRPPTTTSSPPPTSSSSRPPIIIRFPTKKNP
ncbi:MAG TPA: protein kinase [Polyangium sp.]|nr:protein kinase [Polyangium sp.]